MPLPIFSWQSSRPMLSHNFVVIIDALPIPFSKVSSIEVGIDTEPLAEGGENRFVHSLSKPVGFEKTLIFERGVDTDSDSVAVSSANALLRVGSVFKLITICVLDQWGLPKKMYAATHAILKKRRLSDLNALGGEVFVESLEFIYRDITEIPGVSSIFTPQEISKYKSAQGNAGKKPEKFTKPLNPKPPKKSAPARFTLPRNDG